MNKELPIVNPEEIHQRIQTAVINAEALFEDPATASDAQMYGDICNVSYSPEVKTLAQFENSLPETILIGAMAPYTLLTNFAFIFGNALDRQYRVPEHSTVSVSEVEYWGGEYTLDQGNFLEICTMYGAFADRITAASKLTVYERQIDGSIRAREPKVVGRQYIPQNDNHVINGALQRLEKTVNEIRDAVKD